MRAFRIGYILTLSFLLILTLVMLTFGFYPAPTGPKMPEYPNYASDSTDSYDPTAYQRQMNEYTEAQETYKAQQSTFMQDHIVPYARNVFVIWILSLVVFQVVGLILIRSVSDIAGAAFSFSGVWAVIFGPLGGMLWFASSLAASFGARADQTYSAEPIFQAIGIISLLGSIILTVLGIILMKKHTPTTAPASAHV